MKSKTLIRICSAVVFSVLILFILFFSTLGVLSFLHNLYSVGVVFLLLASLFVSKSIEGYKVVKEIKL